MTMNNETIKAAEEYAKERPFWTASQSAFLAGAEYKQKQIDELMDWVISLKGIVEEFDNEFNNPVLNKLIQNHKP